MDIGAEYGFYSADVTRTIPIDGRFSQQQRDIYEIVLAAQEAAIEVMVPGKGAREYYTHAEDVIKEGLYRLGLITDRHTMWQHRAYYYPFIGHWLGLDPHDAGRYGDGPAGRPLEPGMVLTVEPGLYFGENMIEVFRQSMLRRGRIEEAELDSFLQQVRPVFERYMHIGVRIEDDVLITPDGNRILSAGAPKTVKDIEATMKKKSRFN
jgi:Xaa-Pro aminopeptidase